MNSIIQEDIFICSVEKILELIQQALSEIAESRLSTK